MFIKINNDKKHKNFHDFAGFFFAVFKEYFSVVTFAKMVKNQENH